MNAAAPLTVEWPDGNSGCAGVPAGKKSSHGFQAGSGSILPSRTAGIGRQSTNRDLASQHAIAASAIATFSRANKWAFSDKVKCCAVEIWDAIRIQNSGVLPAQNSENSDW